MGRSLRHIGRSLACCQTKELFEGISNGLMQKLPLFAVVFVSAGRHRSVLM
jgi:hypothetical protein